MQPFRKQFPLGIREIRIARYNYPIITYDNLIRMVDDPDVREPLKFLRARELVHYQRFGDALRLAQDSMNSKNFYAVNPSFDR